MKEYKDFFQEKANIVCDPGAIAYDVPQFQQCPTPSREFKIPRDENGKPIGKPWEEVLERMYDNLSEHYGVDLRTL